MMANDADVERVARAMAAHHYALRFDKPLTDPQVVENVEANWRLQEELARVAITAMPEVIEPGKTYIAYRQGRAITPQKIRVRVSWIDGDDVWYVKDGSTTTDHTTRGRFLEIINPRFTRS